MSAIPLASGSTWGATVVRTVSAVMAFAFAGPYRPRLRYSAPENLPGALLGIGVLLPVCAWSAVPTLLTPRDTDGWVAATVPLPVGRRR
jgi:hypothetical protein